MTSAGGDSTAAASAAARPLVAARHQQGHRLAIVIGSAT
jgi:hypothetical protein